MMYIILCEMLSMLSANQQVVYHLNDVRKTVFNSAGCLD